MHAHAYRFIIHVPERKQRCLIARNPKMVISVSAHRHVFHIMIIIKGKDKDIFITKEDYENPEVREELIVAEDYGPILPSGEINWDCPCLGGMAYGPCGEEFRAAFSCFVYSKAEEKGIDCLQEFQTMQNCMEQHPDVYQEEEELENDELTKTSKIATSQLTDGKDNSDINTIK